jgi:serine/threonine protein kinase
MLQIVFRVGGGHIPTIPARLQGTQCADFLSHCFQHNPIARWTANQLSEHPFANIVGMNL